MRDRAAMWEDGVVRRVSQQMQGPRLSRRVAWHPAAERHLDGRVAGGEETGQAGWDVSFHRQVRGIEEAAAADGHGPVRLRPADRGLTAASVRWFDSQTCVTTSRTGGKPSWLRDRSG